MRLMAKSVTKKIYKHSDMDQLETMLAETMNHPSRWVITDGVFSMDGDIAPLPGIVEAAEEVGAIIMVDDAHGEGVLGSHGRTRLYDLLVGSVCEYLLRYAPVPLVIIPGPRCRAKGEKKMGKR